MKKIRILSFLLAALLACAAAPVRADELDLVPGLELSPGRFSTTYTNPMTPLSPDKLLVWDEPMTVVPLNSDAPAASVSLPESSCLDGLRLYRYESGIAYLCENREADGKLDSQLSFFDGDLSLTAKIRLQDIFGGESYVPFNQVCDVSPGGDKISCADDIKNQVLEYDRTTAAARLVWDYSAELNSIDGLTVAPDGNALYFVAGKGAENEIGFGYYDAVRNESAFYLFEKVNGGQIQAAAAGALFLEEIGDPNRPVSGIAYLVRPAETEPVRELRFEELQESRNAYLSENGDFIATLAYSGSIEATDTPGEPRTLRIRIYSVDPLEEIRAIQLTQTDLNAGFAVLATWIDDGSRALYAVYMNGGRRFIDRYDF